MLEVTYLLASHISLWKTPDGVVHIDKLWYLDLRRHLEYIRKLVLACPVHSVATAPADSTALDVNDPVIKRLELLPLPGQTSTWKAMAAFPLAYARLLKCARRCQVVHSHVVGWPMPTAWAAVPAARRAGTASLVLIESWPVASKQPGLLDRMKERIARWCVRKSQLVIYTHSGYVKQFPHEDPSRQHVLPASWIDADWLANASDVQERWKLRSGKRALRVMFAARLVEEKGTTLLLEAIRQLRHTSTGDASIEIDIFGSGPLVDACKEAAAVWDDTIKVQFLGMLEYGKPFLSKLAEYDLVVVPGTGSEQPRIIYDAFSQGVPVLTSDTAGNLEVVRPGVNGNVFRNGDPAALAQALENLARQPDGLPAMATQALGTAGQYTHQEMHRRRKELIAATLLGGK